MTDSINVVARPTIAKVGDAEGFQSALATFSGAYQASATALATMLAYAHHAWHTKADFDPQNQIRAAVHLPKDAGARFDRLLNAIKRDKPEGSPAKAAVSFANEAVASFYREGTKLSKARAEASRKARVEKATAALKAEREAGKAEVPALPDFCLIGPELVLECSAAEFAELKGYLATIREAIAEQGRSNVRQSAKLERAA